MVDLGGNGGFGENMVDLGESKVDLGKTMVALGGKDGFEKIIANLGKCGGFGGMWGILEKNGWFKEDVVDLG